MILGHRDYKTNKEQSLKSHLFNVANSAAIKAEILNQYNTCYLLGLLHDLGKADRQFQDKLISHPNKKVNHSSAGAKYFLEYISTTNKLTSQIPKEHYTLFYEFIEIIIYVITSHHGIYDIWKTTSEDNQMENRIQYDSNDSYNYKSDILTFASELESDLYKKRTMTFSNLILKSFEEFVCLDDKLNPEDKEEKAFYSSLKVRLLLSILKNADIEDTVNAYENIIEPFTEKTIENKKKMYLNQIEKLYTHFSVPKNQIDKIRNRLGEEGLKRGQTDGPGIYQLNLPTGAGKTLISLRYGMHQLSNKSKSRYIYITPFLSVLEQNAKEIKTILNDPDIIEHHSNVIKNESSKENSSESDEKTEAFEEYLTNTWDSPVVLSTMVQFFQTLFKGKSSNIRRYSSLINAVIVLDEVQSLPVTVTTLFNLSMNFISQAMNSTVVMCTATQPPYDSPYIKHKMKYNNKNETESNIVSLTDEERAIFDRTVVNKLNDNEITTLDEIEKEIIDYPEESVLVVLNTKNAVRQVYDALAATTPRRLYYLSTNLCPLHRQRIVEDMKEKLTLNEPIICISTQLIEAGVDIDFDRLIRSYSGVDSIIQAMGRCNRHGKNKKKGVVNLVQISKELENIDKIKEIKDKVTVTSYILKRAESPIDMVSLNSDFYERYYANNQIAMDYPIPIKESPSGFDYLSINQSLYNSSLSKKSMFKILNQSFKTAASHIDLIKNDTTGVIVYYEESIELINELILVINEYEHSFEGELLKRIKKLSELLQPYTVNMYLSYHNQPQIISYLNGRINILTDDFYNKETGVVEQLDSLII